MKKALSVFLMAAMAFGAFADEPVADVNVAEFSGNAAVTWGVDLDSGKTGFTNSTEVNLKLNLLKGGTKSTTGDGVWGELVLKADGDPIQWQQKDFSDKAFDANKGMMDGGTLKYKVYVDTAKIHFGPAYVGIKSGDTTVGQLKLDSAVRADKAWLTDVGAKKTDGIVVGFDSDLVKVDVDIRSAKGYTDDYGMAAEVELKAIENLSVKGGISYEFNNPNTLGYAASAGYKLALDDTYYIRPQVGITGTDAKDSTVLAAGVLFGWGAMADTNAGVYYIDNDNAKKVTPGVSVNAYVPLAKDQTVVVRPSFFSGELIPGLTAAAIADIVIPTVEGADSKFGFAFGVKYAATVDALTITPKAGIAFTNNDIVYNENNTQTANGKTVENIEDGTDVLQAKVGVDVAGLIDNTTLSAEWVSGDLITDKMDAKKGELKFTAKIAL